MQVEIFSDVVCPWCYLGKRRFEAALRGFEHRDDVSVTYRSFQLDPSAPQQAGPATEMLSRKYGMTPARADQLQRQMEQRAAGDGLEYHLDGQLTGNTRDAHRLLHLAAARGLQAEVAERLFAGYFTDRRSVFTHAELTELAAEAGLDAAQVADALASGAYAAEVDADLALAREFGITAVPFFVFDRRYGVSGAQPTETLRRTLEQAWAEQADQPA
jgi:predicted DsbA family dithiol-disulfide isomerase